MHHDSQICFSGYCINSYKKMLDAVVILHERILQIKMISWDVTLYGNETSIIVETDLEGQSICLTQMAHGRGAFGKNTPEILRYIRKYNKYV